MKRKMGKRNKAFIVWVTIFVSLCAIVYFTRGQAIKVQQTVTLDFHSSPVGSAPSGWTSYATGSDPPVKWLVKAMDNAPGARHVIMQTDADTTDGRFPVLISDQGEYRNLDVSIRGKAIAGKLNQGIGLVFRFRDPKSYYVVRANALEDNVGLYKMVNGNRVQIAGSSTKVASGQWHKLRAVARGERILCYFDGKQVISASDDTYSTGKVGFWTKADSLVAFDELTVAPVQ